MDGGEFLARVHSVVPDRGIRHELQPLDEALVWRFTRVVDQLFAPAAAAIVERGAELLRKEVMSRPAPRLALAHGDWLAKHLRIETARSSASSTGSSPARRRRRSTSPVGGVRRRALQDRSDLLRRGYARITNPDSADAGWEPASAIDWTLDKLGWKNPAPPAQQRRCVDVIARYAGA